MGKMKITCEEATTICTKSQYGEATLMDKIKLSFHFMFCKVCKMFSKQNAELTDMCAMAKKHNEEHGCLSDADKERLKQQIKELNKE